MHSQLDSKGHQTLVMSDIVDHQIDGIIATKENGFTWKHFNILNNTTKVWEVLIEWKDETKT